MKDQKSNVQDDEHIDREIIFRKCTKSLFSTLVLYYTTTYIHTCFKKVLALAALFERVLKLRMAFCWRRNFSFNISGEAKNVGGTGDVNLTYPFFVDLCNTKFIDFSCLGRKGGGFSEISLYLSCIR